MLREPLKGSSDIQDEASDHSHLSLWTFHEPQPFMMYYPEELQSPCLDKHKLEAIIVQDR